MQSIGNGSKNQPKEKEKRFGVQGDFLKIPLGRGRSREIPRLSPPEGPNFYLLISTLPLRRPNAKHWEWVEGPAQPFPKFCSLVNLGTASFPGF